MAKKPDPYFETKWGMLIADCWEDDELKQRLLSDPASVLKERGITLPAGVQVKVVQDSESLTHLTIPAKPAEGELSEMELESVAGGHGCSSCASCSTCVSRCVTACVSACVSACGGCSTCAPRCGPPSCSTCAPRCRC